MKILLAVLVVAVLGTVAFLVLVEPSGRGSERRGSERGARGAAPSPSAAPEEEDRADSELPLAIEADRSPATQERDAVEPSSALEPSAVVEGTIIAEGAPLAGAEVRLARNEDILAETRSDARGRFRLDTQPLRAPAQLSVLARGFVHLERKIEARPMGGTTLLGNLRLVRGQRVSGRVVDSSGNGVAEARLRVEPDSPGIDTLVARGSSGVDGRFEVADVPPGSVLVHVEARGYGEASLPYSPGDELLIELLPGSEVRLFLRTPQGTPVVGADVTIQSLEKEKERAGRKTGISDAHGRLAFEGLSSDVWSVRVTHPEYRPAGEARILANRGETEILCQPWPAIEGSIRAPDGKPAPPGTRVQALPAATPGDRVAGLAGGQEVAPDGSFRIGGLRPGDWRVRVAAPGFAPTTSIAVKLAHDRDGNTGTIELLAGATLLVRPLLEGAPVEDAEVEAFAVPPTPAQLWALASSRAPGTGRRVSTAGGGTARIGDIAPGSVWVAVYREGSPPTSSGPHQAGLDPAPAPIEVPVERGARVKGRVTREDGSPSPHCQLRIVERVGRLGFPITLASDERGRYSTSWLPPGSYTIEAFTPGEAERRTGPIEFELEPGEEHSLDLEL